MNNNKYCIYSFLTTEKDFGARVSGKARFAYLQPNTPELKDESKVARKNNQEWFGEYQKALTEHSEKVKMVQADMNSLSIEEYFEWEKDLGTEIERLNKKK